MLCVPVFWYLRVSGCLHTGLRGFFCQTASRKSRHTSLTSWSAERRLNTIDGFHGNKGVGRWLRASELVAVHSILCEVLVVKLRHRISLHQTARAVLHFIHYAVTWCCWFRWWQDDVGYTQRTFYLFKSSSVKVIINITLILHIWWLHNCQW